MWLVWVVLALLVFLVLAVSYRSQVETTRQKMEALREEILAGGDRYIIEPQEVSYRGSEQKYGRIKCDGVGGVTHTRLVFVPLVGKSLEIPLEHIRSVTETRWFLGSARWGFDHLIVETRDGNRIGFFTRNNALWKQRLAGAGVRVEE